MISDEVKPGLKENRYQFILLLVVNAFLGEMVGLERTILPGWGTALVYPTFLSTLAENTHLADRAKSL